MELIYQFLWSHALTALVNVIVIVGLLVILHSYFMSKR